MEIIIEGKQAVIKKGTSFQYISENRSFSSADSYTFAITFPLRGCSQNIEIFGNINRADMSKNKILFDCQIRDKEFLAIGYITVTNITDVEVKCQFLEGRSVQNFDDSFDDVYINELDIGVPEDLTPSAPFLTHKCIGSYDQTNYVALPWVNNASGNIQNDYQVDGGSPTPYSAANLNLSYQPYLLYVIKRIFSCVEYDIDISELEKSDYKHLLICNCLPYEWNSPNFKEVLPNWSITEFVEEIEQLLNCEFDIDHNNKSVTVQFAKGVTSTIAPTFISTVIDDYTVDVSKSDDSKFPDTANLSYNYDSSEYWKYLTAKSVIEDDEEIFIFETWSDFYNEAILYKNWSPHREDPNNPLMVNHVSFVKSLDTYFIMKCVDVYQKGINPITGKPIMGAVLQPIPINQFGPKVIKIDNKNEQKFNVIPVRIDSTDKGMVIFIDLPEMSSDDNSGNVDNSDSIDLDNFQTRPARKIKSGANNEREEIFSKLFVAFWDGVVRSPRKLMYPVIDPVTVLDTWQLITSPYSLRLNNNTGLGFLRKRDFVVDPLQKYTFKFISEQNLNPRALYYINNKKFVCAKLTTQFDESGRSNLVTGEFFPVS